VLAFRNLAKGRAAREQMTGVRFELAGAAA
jgi:hypothetical protein